MNEDGINVYFAGSVQLHTGVNFNKLNVRDFGKVKITSSGQFLVPTVGIESGYTF